MAAAWLALAPLLIHLLSRRRYRREPWAAMVFLRQALAQTRMRTRLEQWLLLAMRTLLILLFGAAVSRPHFGSGGGPMAADARPRDLVLVIDDTLSMQAAVAQSPAESGRMATTVTGAKAAGAANGADLPNGPSTTVASPQAGAGIKTCFDLAVSQAEAVLATMRPGDRVGIVTVAGARMRTAALIVGDEDARRILRGLTCTFDAGRSDAALATADRLLAAGSAEAGDRVVHLFTDAAATGWPEQAGRGATSRPETASHIAVTTPTGAGDSPLADAASTAHIDALVLHVATPATRDNLAVTRLECRRDFAHLRIGAATAEIVTHSAATQVGARIEWRIGEQVVRTDPLPMLRPDTPVMVAADLDLPEAGDAAITARVIPPGPDAMEADNLRYAVVPAAAAKSILLVQERLAASEREEPLFYLAAALATAAREDAGEATLTTVSPDQLAGRILDESAVIVLGDVPTLGRALWTRVAQFVRDGGGLLVVAGRRVQTTDYNRAAEANSAEGATLPVTLVDGEVGWATAPTDDSEPMAATMPTAAEGIGVAFVDAGLSSLRDLAGHDRGGLRQARVSAWRRVRSDAAPAGRVVLRLTNGAPLLVSAEVGRGRVQVWLGGLDLRDSNLPAKPDFVPLVLGMVEELTAGRTRLETRVVDSAKAAWSRPGFVRDGASEMPVNEKRNSHPTPKSESDRSLDNRTLTPALSLEGRGSQVAVNVDGREGDLRPIEATQWAALAGVPTWMAESGAAESQSGDATPVDGAPVRPGEWSHAAMWAVLALAVVESLTAVWFGRRT